MRNNQRIQSRSRISAAKIRPGCFALFFCLFATNGFGQTPDPQNYHFLVDEEEVIPDSTVTPGDFIQVLLQDGYPLVEIDSMRVVDATATVYITRGPRIVVDRLEIEGLTLLDEALTRSRLGTREGRPLDPGVLEEDILIILAELESAGRPLAEATVSEITLGDEGFIVRITIDEGRPLVLWGIELFPDGRTSPTFVARLAGIELNRPLDTFYPVAIQRDLEASGIFESVGEPVLIQDENERLILRIPVEEMQPGAFDLVFGYLPPDTEGEPGRMMGNGSLVLRNLFGRGLRLSLELVRNPGLVSSVDVRVGDPFFLGLPFMLEGRFSGYQRDSTFSFRSFGLEGGYRLARGLELLVVVSNERVESGIAGNEIIEGQYTISNAQGWFAGVGVRFERVDRPMNPRSGIIFESIIEEGTRQRQLVEGSIEPTSVRRQRFQTRGRVFVPTFRRQTIVLGADARILLGEYFDTSDLFRFGGATTMRGYDEEQFLGRIVGRGLIEYRYQLDPTSFAFVFADIGYVDRPITPGIPELREWLTGYGFGLQYRTPLGLATASYALNPDEGVTRGKVHIGLSIGL